MINQSYLIVNYWLLQIFIVLILFIIFYAMTILLMSPSKVDVRRLSLKVYGFYSKKQQFLQIPYLKQKLIHETINRMYAQHLLYEVW